MVMFRSYGFPEAGRFPSIVGIQNQNGYEVSGAPRVLAHSLTRALATVEFLDWEGYTFHHPAGEVICDHQVK